MADIQWPDGLRGPLVSVSSEEVVGFRDADLAAGPPFVELFTEDTPTYFNLSFVFGPGDNRRFQLWLRQNQFKLKSPWFDCPLPDSDPSITTQECRFTATGYPQVQGRSTNGMVTYSATVIAREVINNDDEYETEVDAMWGTNCGNIALGSSLLDEGLNE